MNEIQLKIIVFESFNYKIFQLENNNQMNR